MANDVATSLPALDYDKAFTLTVSVDDPAAVVSEIVVYGVMLNEADADGRVPTVGPIEWLHLEENLFAPEGA